MDTAPAFRGWQSRTFAMIWITYLSFYLVRLNFSVAMPGLITDQGFTKTQLGSVLTAFFIAYALGQFVNGHVGNNRDSRYFITTGLVASAVINILLGLFFSTQLWMLVVLWGLNGYFQSMGWGPAVKTVANWFSPAERTSRAVMLGTSYILGSAVALFVAGVVIHMFTWRAVLIIPAFVSLFVACNWLYFGRWRPEDVDPGWSRLVGRVNAKPVAKGAGNLFACSLLSKPVLMAGVALLGLNIVRYGFLDWAPTFLFETHQTTVSSAAYKSLLFPLAGTLGVLAIGKATGKEWIRNHERVGAYLLGALLLGLLLFPSVFSSASASTVLLIVIGLLSFAPHVLLVSVLPMKFAGERSASAAAGTIDALGYVGAALSGYLTGFLVDHYGWSHGLYFWAAGAAVSCIAMILLSRLPQPGGVRTR